MDSKYLAESAVGVLTPLFDGLLYGKGERTAAELYPVIARRLRAAGDGATVSGWEAAPGTPRAGEALATVLERRLAEDAYFAGDVAGVLARMPEAAMPAVPPPGHRGPRPHRRPGRARRRRGRRPGAGDRAAHHRLTARPPDTVACVVIDLRAKLTAPVDRAARALLGCTLSAGGVTVRLTEVEAYAGTGADPASHAHRGRTARNAVMFGPAGFAYVYFTYGMHWCMNVVTGAEGTASAVLLRAGEVVSGLDVARARRPAIRRDVDLARGPARLCATLGIDREAYGLDLLDDAGPVRLAPPARPVARAAVATGPRVGVTGALDLPWRFWVAGDPTVSAYRRHVPRERPTI